MQPSAYFRYQEEKQHTPENFPYNTYLCTIPMDFPAVSLHWHNEAELIVIQKGEGLVRVDFRQYTVKAGDIVFVFPGQLHSIAQKSSAIMEYENILFQPGLLLSPEEDPCCTGFLAALFANGCRMGAVCDRSWPAYPAVSALLRQIDALCDSKPCGYQVAVKGLLFQLFYQLITERTQLPGKEKQSQERLKSALRYVAEHYAEPISVPEIAAYCYYSPSYFMKAFKRATGMPFVQYLKHYRLEKAAALLRETNRTILEIAMETGFDNLSYFTRSFKEKYGISPGKFRTPPKTEAETAS